VARAVVILLALAWLSAVIRSAGVLADRLVIADAVDVTLKTILILLAADIAWNVAKTYIDHRLGNHDATAGDDNLKARDQRLRTLLPIFRNSLAVFIVLVACLTILAGMGVQIGPLVAGAGIFGVAIGFGSQTLVRDVISGVFYMLDDAFRVGEYIQSGSYMGTVEGFSLRSVRLRHHRGPIYTVPFGELGAVQNMSRDWAIDKMTVNVTYDADIDLARKLVKQIGQDLAKDPEFAPIVIQPLKMQGVDSFGEFAIALKLKMVTKPGQQFTMKRRALLMIKKAFDENGIKIATPTVQVSGSSDAASAAAAQATVRRRKASAANAG
jgi:small-conductance mechanosensitive channel